MHFAIPVSYLVLAMEFVVNYEIKVIEKQFFVSSFSNMHTKY